MFGADYDILGAKEKQKFGEMMRNKRSFFIIVFLLLLLVLAGCGKKKVQTAKEPVKEQEAGKAVYDEVADMVFMGADLEKKTVTLQNVTDGTRYVLNYTGGTLVYNASESPITVEQIPLGELVEASFNYADSKLGRLQILKDGWTCKEVEDAQVSRTDYRMKLYGDNYQFTDRLVIFSEGKEIGINELQEKDVLTVRGIGKNVCSVVVERGHGYVVLQGYENFVDGWVEVGQVITRVKEDMILMVPEGEYVLTVEKNGFGGYKNITVKRDQETQVDVSDLKEAAPRSGNVRFQITPEGATLLIAGKETDYSNLVALDYGVYKVKVMADGYETYEGKLTVDDLVKTQKIDLKKEGESEGGTTANPTESSSSGSSENSSKSSSSDSQDSDGIYKLTVSDPEGVQVYLDGSYMGTAPVSFKKTSGSHKITLRKSGYQTKTYTIEVDSEKKDLNMAFPALTKSSSTGSSDSTSSILNDILMDTLFSD